MSPRALNTMLVQRIETALGVPLSQESKIARGPTSSVVPPLGKPLSVPPVESSTHKTTFAHEVSQRASDAKQAAARTGHQAVDRASGLALQSGHKPLPTSITPPSSTQMQLSPVGKLIYSLFEQFPQGAGPLRSDQPLFITTLAKLREMAVDRTTTIESNLRQRSDSNSHVLPPSSSTLSGLLGLTLQHSIVQSGLFYEAQLIRALSGDPRRLEELKKQPQGQLSARHLDKVKEELSLPIRSIMRQQLDVLSNHAIQWQGQAWPGAHMEWEIRPHLEGGHDLGQPGAESGNDEDARAWSTTIMLDMPRLGMIDVNIWVSENSTKLIMRPRFDPEVLLGAKDQLYQRLEQAGIEVKQIDVMKTQEELSQSEHDGALNE